jgi:ribokinase
MVAVCDTQTLSAYCVRLRHRKVWVKRSGENGLRVAVEGEPCRAESHPDHAAPAPERHWPDGPSTLTVARHGDTTAGQAFADRKREGESLPDTLVRVSAGPGRVVVVGSINADWVVEVPELPGPGETVVGSAITHGHGGKGANQAVAAARSRAAVAMVGAIGDDQVGDRELAALEAAGIDISQIRRVASATTGVAMIAVDPRGENQIVVAPGANALLDGDDVTSALDAIALGPRDVVLVCNEITSVAVLAAAGEARRTGARLVLNPAPPRPIDQAVLAQIAVLTPNTSEALALSGASDAHEAALTLSALTGAAVIVTAGRAGALLASSPARPISMIAAPLCEPVDTVGAGDVFNGVLAARLVAGDELPAATELAVTRASESTGWPGARAPADWPDWGECS